MKNLVCKGQFNRHQVNAISLDWSISPRFYNTTKNHTRYPNKVLS